MPSRIFSLKNPGWAAMALALAMVVLLLLDRVLAVAVLAPLRERVDPHEQRRPEGHHEGRGAERAGHELRDVLVRRAGPQRELLEVEVADVEPARAAGLVLAVDVVHVAVGVRVDAGLGELEQLAAAPVGERAGRADLGAGGLEPLRLA